MTKHFEETKRQLAELAAVLNSFKSEAVQLRIIELVLQSGADRGAPQSGGDPVDTKPPSTARNGKTTVSEPTFENGKHGLKSRRRAGGSGPVSTLELLIREGFFGKRQTIGRVVEHCVSSKARNFKPYEISGPLSRLVRGNKLKRKKNADGQFEYFV